MKIVHIVVGDLAAASLNKGLPEENFPGENIFVVKDVFNIGPLKSETLKFSDLRIAFWKEVNEDEKEVIVDDLERLMELSSKLSNGNVEQVWFWMAGIPADICTYYWLLHFLKKHLGKLFVVNIDGLPFLDESGKLFYPESIAHLPPRQIQKARKLCRVVTSSEWETDGEGWKQLLSENQGIRIHSGNKKITGKPISHYDNLLTDYLAEGSQKISKIIHNVMKQHKIYTGDSFLLWRYRMIAASANDIPHNNN